MGISKALSMSFFLFPPMHFGYAKHCFSNHQSIQIKRSECHRAACRKHPPSCWHKLGGTRQPMPYLPPSQQPTRCRHTQMFDYPIATTADVEFKTCNLKVFKHRSSNNAAFFFIIIISPHLFFSYINVYSEHIFRKKWTGQIMVLLISSQLDSSFHPLCE